MNLELSLFTGLNGPHAFHYNVDEWVKHQQTKFFSATVRHLDRSSVSRTARVQLGYEAQNNTDNFFCL